MLAGVGIEKKEAEVEIRSTGQDRGAEIEKDLAVGKDAAPEVGKSAADRGQEAANAGKGRSPAVGIEDVRGLDPVAAKDHEVGSDPGGLDLAARIVQGSLDQKAEKDQESQGREVTKVETAKTRKTAT